MSDDVLRSIQDYVTSVADPDGSFRASPVPGWLGIADSRVSELAAAVYAAEVFQTLGLTLPHPRRTADFIQSHQHREGYFETVEPASGRTTLTYRLYNTCVGIRGLRALGHMPRHDPAPWIAGYVRSLDDVGPYMPDFCANAYAALGKTVPGDCLERLDAFLLATQEPDSGWFMQPGMAERGRPFERNNPFTFHAVRYYHLTGRVVPKADSILDTFMRVQQPDGSWSLGGVHGNFDACVAIRILGGTGSPYREAVERAAEWSLRCRTEDGGFRHFGPSAPADLADAVTNPSEMDALYFHTATLVMAGRLPNAVGLENNWIGWGHSLTR